LRSRWITGVLVCAGAVGLAALLGAAMTTPPAVTAAGQLAPTEQEDYVARRVADIVAREHYRRAPLDDRLSSLILDRYLDAIDGGRSYFYASDIAEFEKYRYELDDAIKAGDMEPAFVIFRRFQQRNRERMNYAIELLAKKPDFDVDESFNFDREKEPWPANTAEMNELWRKRVKNDALSLVIAGKQWPDVVDVLRKRYEHVEKRMDQSKPEDVFEAFMNAYVLSLDPHSNYFSPRNSEEYNIQMSLSYEGIGASLNLTDDYVTVVDVIAGGPAAVSGKLAANDRVTAVGEGKTGELVDVIGWRLDDVVQKIRGPGGTVVRLQILPAGAAPGSAQKVVDFTRNRVSLEAQASHKAMRVIQRNGRDIKVGIITVPSFYQDYDASRAGAKDFRSTTRDVQRLIDELRKDGAEVLIMDLRANGGGYLPVHRSGTGRAAARHDRPHRGRRRSGAVDFLRRSADRVGGSLQRIGFRDFRGRNPGLWARSHRRAADLRQGHRAERAPAQLHDLRSQTGARPAQCDDRQVLPHHGREHPGSRRHARYRAAVVDRCQRGRREHSRPRVAVGPHQPRGIQDRRGSEAGHGRAAKGARGAHQG
jgi:carboxyl-terminal processing protease